eukprot:g2656.t1
MNVRHLLVIYCWFLSFAFSVEGRRLFLNEHPTSSRKSYVGSAVAYLNNPDALSHKSAHMKILFPSSGNFIGLSASPKEGPPYPVIIFPPGALVESNRYQWLGEELVVHTGVAFVTYDQMGNFNGTDFLLSVVSDNSTGVRGSSIIKVILDKLIEFNNTGTLAGRLDLDRIILGGHSSGGSLALFTGNKEFLPSCIGVFTYGTHTADLSPRAVPPVSIRPIPGNVPLLLMVGTHDGVIQRTRSLHDTQWENSTVLVRRMYQEGLEPGRPACYVALDGANHMAILNPEDFTLPNTARDFALTRPKKLVEQVLSHVITKFVHGVLQNATLDEQSYKSVATFQDQVPIEVMCKT